MAVMICCPKCEQWECVELDEEGYPYCHECNLGFTFDDNFRVETVEVEN